MYLYFRTCIQKHYRESLSCVLIRRSAIQLMFTGYWIPQNEVDLHFIDWSLYGVDCVFPCGLHTDNNKHVNKLTLCSHFHRTARIYSFLYLNNVYSMICSMYLMKEKSEQTHILHYNRVLYSNILLLDNATYNKWQGIKYNVQKIHGIQLKGIIPNK